MSVIRGGGEVSRGGGVRNPKGLGFSDYPNPKHRQNRILGFRFEGLEFRVE